MSSSQPSKTSNAPFWTTASFVVLASAGLAASFWPVAIEGARAKSAGLTAEGNQARGSEAQLDFQLARLLDPANQPAALGLARLQVEAGQHEAALQNLRQAGKGSAPLRIRLKAELELGRITSAVTTANLLMQSSNSEADALLAAFAYGSADREDKLAALAPRITSLEGAQRLARYQASKLELAVGLYAQQLPMSSQRILMRLPSSLTRSLLLGQLFLATDSLESLEEARGMFENALAYDPTNREARRGRITALRALNDTEAADKQALLLKRLESGKF